MRYIRRRSKWGLAGRELHSLKAEGEGAVLFPQYQKLLVRDSANVADLGDTLHTPAAWTASGSNTVEDDDGAIKISYVDNSGGAFIFFSEAEGLTQDLVVGREYTVTLQVRVGIGDNVVVRVNDGTTNDDTAIISTTYIPYSFTFVAQSATGAYLRGTSMASGEEIWFKDIEVRQVNQSQYMSFNKAIEDGIIDYTSPSPKLVLHPDGELKYAAHNHCANSEDFSAWTTNNISESNGLITATASSGGHSIDEFDVGYVSDLPVYNRVRVQSGTHDYVIVAMYGGSNDTVSVVADLSTAAITQTDEGSNSGTHISSDVIDNGDGTFDITLIGSITDVADSRLRVAFAQAASGNTINSGGIVTYTPAGTETFTLVRAQCTQYPCDTTYVKTTGSALYTLPVEYDTNGQNGKLVVEPAATNLDNDSRQVGDWSSSAGSGFSQDQVGIDGRENIAWTLTDNDAVSFDFFQKTHTIADDSESHTVSLYFKKTSGASSFPGVEMWFNGGTQMFAIAAINTDTGVATGRTSYIPDNIEVEEIPGWWRMSITHANNSTGNTSLRVGVYPAANADGSATWDATETGSCVIDQIDFVKADKASSPIITAGATGTRAADDISIALSKLPFSPTEGTAVIKFQQRGTNTSTNGDHLFNFNDGTNDERILAYKSSSGGNTSFWASVGGSTEANENTGQITAEIDQGFALGWAEDDYAASLNGAAIADDTNVGIPSGMTTLDIAKNEGSGGYYHCGISSFKYLPRRITDVQLPLEAAA